MKARALFLVVAMTLMVAVMANTSAAPAAPNAKGKNAAPVTAAAGGAVPEEYTEIRNAIDALAAAKAFLIKSDKDFNGHKRNAIAASDAAIQQLRFCLNVSK